MKIELVEYSCIRAVVMHCARALGTQLSTNKIALSVCGLQCAPAWLKKHANGKPTAIAPSIKVEKNAVAPSIKVEPVGES